MRSYITKYVWYCDDFAMNDIYIYIYIFDMEIIHLIAKETPIFLKG